MNYETNMDVPSFLRDQYYDGLLSQGEFNRKAEESLSELEALREFESEEAMKEEIATEHIKADDPFLTENEE